MRTSLGPSLPIPVIQSCTGSVHALTALLLASFAIACAAWIALLRLGLSQRGALGVYACAALIAIGFPYVSTTDAYAYALYGYDAGVSHVNPYDPRGGHLPRTGAERGLAQLFPDRRSQVRVVNYGPVFVGLYAALARAAHGSLYRQILLERMLCAAALLALGLLAGRMTFIALCPLAILESIAFAHADVVMLALLALGYWVYRRGNVGWCAVVVVLAAEVRSIAFLALVVLALDVLRSGRLRGLARATVGTCAAIGVTAALSYAWFGRFSTGGAPVLTAYSSPAVVLAGLAGGSVRAYLFFTGIEALVAMLLAARALLRARYDLASAATMAALPSLFPWYFTWIVAVGSISRDPAFSAAAVAVAIAGVLGEVPLLNAIPVGWCVAMLAVQWVLPIGTYVVVRRLGAQHLQDLPEARRAAV